MSLWNKEVHCKKCGVRVLKKDTKEVIVDCLSIVFEGRWKQYYCEHCKPLYDRIAFFDIAPSRFFSEFQVDRETGEPIGYKKIKGRNNK